VSIDRPAPGFVSIADAITRFQNKVAVQGENPELVFWQACMDREQNIKSVYEALCNAGLIAWFNDGDKERKLETIDWRGAAFWRQIIISGYFRASACEPAQDIDGRRIFVRETELDKFVEASNRAKTPKERAAVAAKVFNWLMRLMSESPKTKPKAEYRKEAMNERFPGLLRTQFDVEWARAIKESGASWSGKGRPKVERKKIENIIEKRF
jgi:hypothetical protein